MCGGGCSQDYSSGVCDHHLSADRQDFFNSFIASLISRGSAVFVVSFEIKRHSSSAVKGIEACVLSSFQILSLTLQYVAKEDVPRGLA